MFDLMQDIRSFLVNDRPGGFFSTKGKIVSLYRSIGFPWRAGKSGHDRALAATALGEMIVPEPVVGAEQHKQEGQIGIPRLGEPGELVDGIERRTHVY